jgi:hypothetical protein
MVMAGRESKASDVLIRSHQMLLEDLRRLDQGARPSRGTTDEDLQKWLAEARGHLADHFRVEEENGYLNAERTREPRLERSAAGLAEEHRQLTQRLEELVKLAQQSSRLDENLLQEVRGWVASVRQHEIRENDLVQDAYNLDLGAED